ncbi:CsbD family protein [Arenivirga flava]|uniref:CsbD-like domain-containing protein n=1 Tax=Arenivirga flava TaxID=1930060 RepID=A0AA37XCB5_9MICO|nr:CsbD family protein [Arenivirga flava]GMA29535.1 hypothetical protein GCM10025874_27880 [Arenivirga flava]
MATDDIKNTAQDLLGKAKEKVGEVTDNDKLAAEGKKDQAAADVKKAGNAVGDALKSDR